MSSRVGGDPEMLVGLLWQFAGFESWSLCVVDFSFGRFGRIARQLLEWVLVQNYFLVPPRLGRLVISNPTVMADRQFS